MFSIIFLLSFPLFLLSIYFCSSHSAASFPTCYYPFLFPPSHAFHSYFFLYFIHNFPLTLPHSFHFRFSFPDTHSAVPFLSCIFIVLPFSSVPLFRFFSSLIFSHKLACLSDFSRCFAFLFRLFS